jgi:hypothetical protein
MDVFGLYYWLHDWATGIQNPFQRKTTKKDHGLFQGPRPGVCYNVGYKKLPTLGIVLTHDDSALRWKRALDNPLVFGIRELKGLEFKSVIILDFFCELPSELQKPWRDFVLNRADILILLHAIHLWRTC